MMKSTPPESTDAMLAEYQAAHNSFHHYDSFRWQSGSLLIAGSLVLWGFVITKQATPMVIGVTSFFVTLLLSIWTLFAHHYRQLYMAKLHRIQEIEMLLQMHVNRRLGFLGQREVIYKIYGPKGHNLDLMIFVAISFFGPVLAMLTVGFAWPLCLSVPLVLGSVWWVRRNEKKMRLMYDRIGFLPCPRVTHLNLSAKSISQ
jgi:hypothetical protein